MTIAQSVKPDAPVWSYLSSYDDILSHVKAVWDRQRANGPICSLILKVITIYHAENGIICATMPVEALDSNSKGTLRVTLSAYVRLKILHIMLGSRFKRLF